MNKKVISIVAIIIVVLIGGVSLFKGNNSKKANNVDEVILIEHKYGETEVKKNPEKVVVLDYGALDIMNAAGIDVVALPKASLPKYLSEYNDDKYVDIGGLKEFDMEKINELNPDLIIIEGRQEEYYEELSKIAPTIGLGTENTDFLGSANKNGEILGKLFNKEEIIGEKLKEIAESLNDVKEKVLNADVDAATVMITDSSLSVYGEKSRFNMIYNEFGFKINDAGVSDSKHGDSISYEYLLDKNPDYIFVIDKNAITKTENTTATDLMNNELIKKTNAYKNNKIIFLDPEAWYVGGSGINSINKRIEEISNSL
ncbi:MAG: ABC transporter substrate-binding protein [Clostridiales bacterium]|nr:ABC transporter substrate-binding protein [Clostridiales bacterium]